MSKDKERFMQKGEEIKVTFVPQCNRCSLNINFNDCKEFSPKPLDYRTNQKECPKKVNDVL